MGLKNVAKDLDDSGYRLWYRFEQGPRNVALLDEREKVQKWHVNESPSGTLIVVGSPSMRFAAAA